MSELYLEHLFNDLHHIAFELGHREAMEVLGVLQQLTWFDNFGEDVYLRRMVLVHKIAATHDGIPDKYNALIEEAADVLDLEVPA